MAYHDSVLSQLLKLVPRLEFEKRANRCDGHRRSDALSRWSQFVALMIGQLGGRRSLRDIEATARSQRHHRYHLGNQSISRSALGRANEQLDYRFYEGLFQSLYQLWNKPSQSRNQNKWDSNGSNRINRHAKFALCRLIRFDPLLSHLT